MGVLEAFTSTWAKARDTFGDGAPPTGAQYDVSGPLGELQAAVRSARPGSAWRGSAAAAYDAANTSHGAVLGQLADLDRQLAARVDQSALIVNGGRAHLDLVRGWVLDAAASVPPGVNRDQLLMPIVKEGLDKLSDIVSTSHRDLSSIGGQIRSIGDEYQALREQKFAPRPKEQRD